MQKMWVFGDTKWSLHDGKVCIYYKYGNQSDIDGENGDNYKENVNLVKWQQNMK